ncbi:hypothetical protein [Pseudomonas sp. NA-150]|uniref:hypothetical protein n=1 Tax=Pseudomonas sp. NA-150 TaxID=3367525 RepID=UPI0037C55E0B
MSNTYWRSIGHHYGISALSLFLMMGSAYGCSQVEKDGIFRTSKLMQDLTVKYSKCTAIGSNVARSACWKQNSLPADGVEAFNTIDSQYSSFLLSCEMDSIKYNLGNFRQSFGHECEAFISFQDIDNKSRYKNLTQVMADSALQCAKSSKDSTQFGDDLGTLRSFISEAVHYKTNGADRVAIGRLLGIWRDYFALHANSANSLSIAKSIQDNDVEWLSWTAFLESLRRHLISWQSALFPHRDNINITVQQYNLSTSKLSK